MGHLLGDIRYAARALLRTPLVTIGIVLTLGLGIGANAAIFGVVDRLFLRPPAGVRGAGRPRLHRARAAGGGGARRVAAGAACRADRSAGGAEIRIGTVVCLGSGDGVEE